MDDPRQQRPVGDDDPDPTPDDARSAPGPTDGSPGGDLARGEAPAEPNEPA